jgi:transposase
MKRVFCGIDLGTRSSSVCVIDESKKVLKRWTGRNEQLALELSKISDELRCVVEAGPLSEKICVEVEQIGGHIEIVDSRHTRGLLHGKKTDRIDAEVLAELCCQGWYKRVYRKGGVAREQRTVVSGRATLVKTTTQLKNTIRGLLKACGIVLPVGTDGKEFAERVRRELRKLTPDVQRTIKDLLAVWLHAHELVRQSSRRLAKLANNNPQVKRLMTVPGVGPVTAMAYVSTIVNPQRFPDGKRVVGYLGLAPRVHQSGPIRYNSRITKQGDKLTRWLLVEAANVMMTRVKTPNPLQEWALALAARKGAAKAKVALARRLAILLFTLWRSATEFTVEKIAA